MTQHDLELIQKMWFGAVDEALEAVRAAAVLGFGVALRNESVPEEDDADAAAEQWIVEIYGDVPAAEPEPVAVPA